MSNSRKKSVTIKTSYKTNYCRSNE